MRKGKIRALFAGIGLAILIFDSQCALEGAKTGLDLCIKVAIPSLFPFLVLSMMLTTSLASTDCAMMRRLSHVMKIPASASPILIPAFLGGYPIGAKCVTDLYRNGILKKQEAERMLAFCSNAGPSFLFGMVSAFFSDKGMIWQLWVIHILGAVFTGMIYPEIPQDDEKSQEVPQHHVPKELIFSALQAMGIVCGWIVLFRTMIAYLNVWIFRYLPTWMQVLSIGFLELSNGCCELTRITNIHLRFVIGSCMLAFGGVCVLVQTESVAKGLSLRHYWIGKSIQTVFSLLMSCAAAASVNLLYAAMIILIMGILTKAKNSGGNPQIYPV